MSWKYETKELSVIYEMLKADERHPDYALLRATAKKACDVALFFSENEMNEEFIKKYLNNKLEIDALTPFHFASSVLCPPEMEIGDCMYSYSHKQWLYSLSQVKLKWTWETEGQSLEELQNTKIERLVTSYNQLQELALSYEE